MFNNNRTAIKLLLSVYFTVFSFILYAYRSTCCMLQGLLFLFLFFILLYYHGVYHVDVVVNSIL